MSTDDHTPDTREVRSMYCAGSNLHRETPEQHYLGAPAPDYGAEFDRFLTRIRREALNGLAEWYQETADLFDKHSGSPEDRERRDESLNRKAEALAYRDTFHPEETHGR